MKDSLLLPNKYRRIGYTLLPFAIAWLVLSSFFNISLFSFLRINQAGTESHGFFSSSEDFPWSKNFSADLNGTIAITLTLVALFLVAFSKEKKEDEYVSSVRLKAFQISIYMNYIILAVATVLVYGFSYLMVIEINLFTIPIIFILVYNYLIYVRPRLGKTP